MTALLNLARKWRSQQFDQIVGQTITVRILKNTLYSNQYFPVYLFSGQKGCGKTSTARIFARSINCQKLPEFQKNPRSTLLPCLECKSCQAMAHLQHPDFIEIDAASHTGVDNVRTIIEAASLLPVLGTKKIYLIDEAHMLSKSAFNAFLKILEEPPVSVLFILATTDPHKIIDTVRSRCFQLFFDPLTIEQLTNHLETICKAESIVADRQALQIIAQESQGCVRDALNLLEQLRFGHPNITVQAVTQNLGYLSEIALQELFSMILNGLTSDVIQWIKKNNEHLRSPLTLWNQCKNYIRSLLHDNTTVASQNLLIICLQKTYEYELLLQKSTQQQGLFELMLLEMVQLCAGKFSGTSSTTPTFSRPTNNNPPIKKEVTSEPSSGPTITTSPSLVSNPEPVVESHLWKEFLQEIEKFSDPLITSVFKQAIYKDHNSDNRQLAIELAQNSPFFKEWIIDTEKIWSPVVEKHFGTGTKLIITYREGSSARQSAPVQVNLSSKNTISTPTQTTKKNNPIDISDKTVWKTAHTLIEAFGGTITESKDDQKIT